MRSDACAQEIPTIKVGAQAFEGDIRSISGLGLGAGIHNHTAKWLSVSAERHASPRCTAAPLDSVSQQTSPQDAAWFLAQTF